MPSDLMNPTLLKSLDKIKERSITNPKARPSMILIDGGQGLGKTTLAKEIADYLAGYETDLNDVVACGGIQFQEKYQICSTKKIPVLIYDEAGDFSKRGALTTFNQTLIRSFETMRAFKIVIILCLPNFNSLDNHLFNIKVPRLLLHIYKQDERRAYLTCHGLYRMLYIRNLMKDLVIKDRAYFKVKPNFYSWFRDLPEAQAKALHEYTINQKMRINEKNVVKMMGLISKKDMGNEIGRTLTWVSLTIKKLNIQPTKVIRGVYYYDESITNRLKNEMKKK